VALRVSVDTTFLIDLQRERATPQKDGPAHRFLRRVPEAELFLCAVALGEFAEGFESADHAIVRTVREHHTLLVVDDRTAEVYSSRVRELRSRGELIGTNDLWIGASAVQHGLPLLTANAGEFRRVKGLEVIAYREVPAPA
jgi:tRNA(fMet)-specific endonuclease VapC